MSLTIHHKPIDGSKSWNIHAWSEIPTTDTSGVVRPDGTIDYVVAAPPDTRTLLFKYYSTDSDHKQTWEDNVYNRQTWRKSATDLWTFEAAARTLDQNPFPAGVVFPLGSVLSFHFITQRFQGGRLYVWDPYLGSAPSFVSETNRDGATGVSQFDLSLAAWMTSGFHFKFVDRNNLWEDDSLNRVWRPCDGDAPWLKEGQRDVRSAEPALQPNMVEVMYPTDLGAAPPLSLSGGAASQTVNATGIRQYATNALFTVATYSVPYLEGAPYWLNIQSPDKSQSSPYTDPSRPFPADPSTPGSMSRLVAGAGGWTDAFSLAAVDLVITPRATSSALGGGVSVQVATIGVATPYGTFPATQQADQTWRVALPMLQNILHTLVVQPAQAEEPKPYDWIDIRRFFTPPSPSASVFTVEGLYGVTTREVGVFQNPPESRFSLMAATFGPAIVAAGVFDPDELPHGTTVLNGFRYFILHAPHAVRAELILIDGKPGNFARRSVVMSLTEDTRYWWCRVPEDEAPFQKRYRFAFNDGIEVLDPACREVIDAGNFDVSPADDPNSANTSWSLVIDIDAVRNTAHQAAWQTMGWQNLLIYEIHPRRFTNIQPGALSSFGLVADEIQAMSRRNQSGYLHQLPVTALELLPIHEFQSGDPWGYQPSFYFAIDTGYGGSMELAKLISRAHANGKAILVDLVYNHMNGSSLTQIASDVYSNIPSDFGDGVNCAHPMVQEFFRQATVHLVWTFGFDGFRFDDTKDIVVHSGQGFLQILRTAIRTASHAVGQPWPYCVCENDPDSYNLTDPTFGAMDGQWHPGEPYSLGQAAYNPWNPGVDNTGSIKGDMDVPQTWVRPYFEATRYGESHDMVSAQNPANQRIAARPPFGLGLQMAKAIGAVTLLSNGVPMFFMGQEFGDVRPFSWDNNGPVINPGDSAAATIDNTRVLAWFTSLIGLRNDATKGLQGDLNLQVVKTAQRTIAFAGGNNGNQIFVIITLGTENQRQNSAWLGLPGASAYKEIFNSSWPVFQVAFEQEQSNGGYTASINSGQILNLPYVGAVVLEKI